MVVAYVVPPFFIAAAARAMIAFGLYCNVLPPLGVAGELAAIGVALSYGFAIAHWSRGSGPASWERRVKRLQIFVVLLLTAVAGIAVYCARSIDQWRNEVPAPGAAVLFLAFGVHVAVKDRDPGLGALLSAVGMLAVVPVAVVGMLTSVTCAEAVYWLVQTF